MRWDANGNEISTEMVFTQRSSYTAWWRIPPSKGTWVSRTMLPMPQLQLKNLFRTCSEQPETALLFTAETFCSHSIRQAVCQFQINNNYNILTKDPHKHLSVERWERGNQWRNSDFGYALYERSLQLFTTVRMRFWRIWAHVLNRLIPPIWWRM